MSAESTVRVTLMIPQAKHEVLRQQAEVRGISLPYYCRMLLSEWANVPEQKQAA